MLPKIFDGLFKKPPSGVKVTAVNMRFLGEAHSLPGMQLTERIFEYTIPFQNKMGSDLLPDQLKGPTMTVSEINVKDPFKLIEIAPTLPVSVPYQTKTAFKLKIEAPDLNYEGPLALEIITDKAESINMNVQKMTLHYNEKSIDVDASSMIIQMSKNQIFKRSVQMYRVFPYNARVNTIEINKPFEIVSTDPKLPLTLDKKDSYLLSIFIKAPQFNYAGTMDVRFT